MRSIVAVQRPLGHELNILVDAEDQIFARQRLALSLPSTCRLRIERGQHAARRAMQVFVKLLLQTAQPVVVDADVAQHLRGDRLFGIEALELLLK